MIEAPQATLNRRRQRQAKALAISFALVALALSMRLLLAPTTLVLGRAASPDGTWAARVEQDISQVSVATPVRRVVLQRVVFGIPMPISVTLVQWSEATADEQASVQWKSPNHPTVQLPAAARTSSRSTGLSSMAVTYQE